MSHEQLIKSTIPLSEITYRGTKIALIIHPITQNRRNHKETIRTVDSDILVNFYYPQTKDFAYSLGLQLRNFFQFLLNHELGLYKILLNSKGIDENDHQPRNCYISHSFLPKKDDFISTEFSYDNIKDDFKRILQKFLEDKSLQDFIQRILMVDQENIPIKAALIILCSAIETYLNETVCPAKQNGLNKFLNKLNFIFYGD